MKKDCEKKEVKKSRSVALPVLPNENRGIARSKTSRWRALSLIILYLLMIAHIIQWRLMGTTVSPIEPSETMHTLQQGAVNAGFIFFTLAILATLIFGRFVCGWGCHIVALQDFCAWLMKKIGVKPKPFRSRLLIFVPLIAALYMFVWPTLVRAFTKPQNAPLIPGFSNHLLTTEFWATFPPVWVAIPFLFICGFVTVYFLGSKGFCTYGCPYGGFFVIADKFAPGKIRVTDDCNQCGHCTATCMSNVQVHAEVAKYGMVIDPGCMKHMDCISVCPNDALYFGFGKPTFRVETRPQIQNPKSKIQNLKYSLTWPEEIGAALIFLLSFLAVWDVYQLVPMLMALGIASVTTFLAVKSWHLLHAESVSFHRFSLKSASGIQKGGWAFLIFALLWIGVNFHSGWVRWHERAGALAFQSLQIPDELALARTNPARWLSAGDLANIAEGKLHFQKARNRGLFTNSDALPKLAWFEYLSGNIAQAVDLLSEAAEHQDGQRKALSLYYRAAILNRLGRYDEAVANLDAALSETQNLTAAHEERGESLWQLGKKEEAVSAWKEALRYNQSLPIANNFLAAAAAAAGKEEESISYEKQAQSSTPDDPRFYWMIGQRLQNLGMNEHAGKHFQRARQLSPATKL